MRSLRLQRERTQRQDSRLRRAGDRWICYANSICAERWCVLVAARIGRRVPNFSYERNYKPAQDIRRHIPRRNDGAFRVRATFMAAFTTTSRIPFRRAPVFGVYPLNRVYVSKV